MAVLEQHYRDEVALWPDTIAPFKIHIIPLDKEGTKAYQLSEQLHDALSNRYEVLFDDRDERPGVKFKDADLIGANYRLVCGRKAQQGLFEVTNLREKTMVEMSFEQLLEFLF